MKKFGALILSGVIAFSAALPAFGAEDIRVYVEEQELSFDQPPVIQNDRTLVPMRGIFEALGAEVQWDSAEKKVNASWSGGSLSLKIGEKEILMGDGSKVTLDVPAQIINSRTMVPLRAVSEAMDAEVQWVKDTREIRITKKAAEEPEPKPEPVPEPVEEKAEPLEDMLEKNYNICYEAFLAEIENKPEEEVTVTDFYHHGMYQFVVSKEGPGHRRIAYSKFMENMKAKDGVEIVKSIKFEDGFGIVAKEDGKKTLAVYLKKDKYLGDFVAIYSEEYEAEHKILLEKFAQKYGIEISQ